MAIARLAAALTERPVLVLGGHSHTVLNAQGFGSGTLIDGVPIIQAGGQGSHVGEFVATIGAASTRQSWTANATLHPLRESPREAGADGGATGPPPFDAAFETEVIAPLVARVQARMDEKLAINDGGAEVSQATTLHQRYAGECALANFVSDALVARSRDFPQGPADLAIVNATAIAAGLPEGRDVTFKDMYRMLPFADCLQLCRMRGSDLLAILRSNAARILRPEELAGPDAVDAGGYVSRGFVHFSRSLRYTIRLQDSAAQAAIADATLDGVPLDQQLDRTLTVVFTNYLGAGGYREAWNGSPIGAGVPGNLASFDLRALPRHDTGLVFRNEIIAYARTVGRIGRATGTVLDGRLAVV
ncbi:MAG: 5'-nucleotidase C-terminal domain-containing protein [Betaproteobacteria bacterium]|nr:5'-nucleotidase C-terminal domain-containing protein [Betaproteobacteria bacterium]